MEAFYLKTAFNKTVGTPMLKDLSMNGIVNNFMGKAWVS